MQRNALVFVSPARRHRRGLVQQCLTHGPGEAWTEARSADMRGDEPEHATRGRSAGAPRAPGGPTGMTIWVPAPPRRADPDGASGARHGAHERALTLLLLGAAGALGVGVAARAADPTVGFSPAATLDALAAQLPVTGPAALALSGAMALELAAGAILMRVLRGAPFPSWSDALLEGYAGAVVLDVLLLFGLGGEGLFRRTPPRRHPGRASCWPGRDCARSSDGGLCSGGRVSAAGHSWRSCGAGPSS